MPTTHLYAPGPHAYLRYPPPRPLLLPLLPLPLLPTYPLAVRVHLPAHALVLNRVCLYIPVCLTFFALDVPPFPQHTTPTVPTHRLRFPTQTFPTRAAWFGCHCLPALRRHRLYIPALVLLVHLPPPACALPPAEVYAAAYAYARATRTYTTFTRTLPYRLYRRFLPLLLPVQRYATHARPCLTTHSQRLQRQVLYRFLSTPLPAHAG